MVCFDHLYAERYRNVFLISFKVDHKTRTMGFTQNQCQCFFMDTDSNKLKHAINATAPKSRHTTGVTN